MALRLLGQLPSALRPRYRQALETLGGLTVGEQLEVACQVVVGILGAERLRVEVSEANRRDYDRLCDAAEEWLQGKIASLRLPWNE